MGWTKTPVKTHWFSAMKIGTPFHSTYLWLWLGPPSKNRIYESRPKQSIFCPCANTPSDVRWCVRSCTTQLFANGNGRLSGWLLRQRRANQSRWPWWSRKSTIKTSQKKSTSKNESTFTVHYSSWFQNILHIYLNDVISTQLAKWIRGEHVEVSVTS